MLNQWDLSIWGYENAELYCSSGAETDGEERQRRGASRRVDESKR